jgi:hypothetical protein
VQNACNFFSVKNIIVNPWSIRSMMKAQGDMHNTAAASVAGEIISKIENSSCFPLRVACFRAYDEK